MIEFNSDNIICGYLVQVLNSFNLPHQHTDTWDGTANEYFYNKKILNNTYKYTGNDTIYTVQLHNYLGDFLRFQRDFNHIDLMCMYNCFTKELASNTYLEVKTKVKTENDSYESKVLSVFDSNDSNYKIYKVPVKFDKQYTLAIDSNYPVEICCDLFSTYEINNSTIDSYMTNDSFIAATWARYNNLKFNTPIVYDKLVNLPQDKLDILYQYEKYLCMFIKIPTHNTSSIVLLEGNYADYTTTRYILEQNNEIVKTRNHTILNFEYKDNINTDKIRLISPLQLLLLNDKKIHPWGDKLIEYLSGMAITPMDNVEDNFKRVQKVMNGKNIDFSFDNIWEEKIRLYLYKEFNDFKLPFEEDHEILGYVDKEVEHIYGNKNETLTNVDIYPNIYLDSKAKEGY